LVSKLLIEGVKTKYWYIAENIRNPPKTVISFKNVPETGLQTRLELIAPYYALFRNHEVAVPIFLNDWALGKVLISGLSAMIRAFPTNDIPILVLFRTIPFQTIMI